MLTDEFKKIQCTKTHIFKDQDAAFFNKIVASTDLGLKIKANDEMTLCQDPDQVLKATFLRATDGAPVKLEIDFLPIKRRKATTITKSTIKKISQIMLGA